MNLRQPPRGGQTRATRRLLHVISLIMAALAIRLLVQVAAILRVGYLDARPKHAPAELPNLLYAADEPVWFYGIVAFMVLLAFGLLSIAWKMWRPPPYALHQTP